MGTQVRDARVGAAAVAIAIASMAVQPTAGQTAAGQTPLGSNQLQTQLRRLQNGKPDLSGIWQAVNTANWDLEGQAGGPSPVVALGAIGATPPGLGVVEGGKIPYQPWALAKKQENYKNRLTYEALIEDPKVFTRPWKISMPLYRRLEKNMQLLEFKCAEYTEELLWGQYRKQPAK